MARSIARDIGLESIAFPAISCGMFRYPSQETAAVAVGSINVLRQQ
jgi:O-acetyl-ADP-ribose deacetylase (regulator of RNase III)